MIRAATCLFSLLHPFFSGDVCNGSNWLFPDQVQWQIYRYGLSHITDCIVYAKNSLSARNSLSNFQRGHWNVTAYKSNKSKVFHTSWYWLIYPVGTFCYAGLSSRSSFPLQSISTQEVIFPLWKLEREMWREIQSSSVPVKPAHGYNILWDVSVQAVIYSPE